MKKILFFAGLLAFVTSCTDDELISSGSYNQELPNGISFSTTFAEMPESRGMLTYDEAAQNFPFFWYAERDQIKIYPFGEVMKANANYEPTTSVNTHENWGKFTPASAAAGFVTYKATQSKSDGKFTALAAEDLLVFADSTTTENNKDNKTLAQATFAATYNATVDSIVFDPATKAIKKIAFKPANLLGSLQAKGFEQDLTGDHNVTEYMPMYGVSQATQAAEYSSVGESVDMRFYRHGAILGFQTSGIDETYSKLFGKLDSIEVKMLGGKDIKPSALAYNYSTIADHPSYVIEVDAEDASKNVFKLAKNNSVANADDDSIHAIKAVYNKEWSDDDIAYVAIAPVDRGGKEEKYIVRYVFEKISFVSDTITTKSNWASKGNGVVQMNKAKLDMSKHNYLVIKNSVAQGDPQTYSLLVNNGTFASALSSDGAKLKWDGDIAVTAIDTVISKVAMTEAEVKSLAKFTGLKYLQLDEVTSLPKEALNASLDYINLPKVTTIDKAWNKEDATPATVLLPAYKFDNAEVNETLITSSLKKLDMSGVEKVEETFETPCALSLADATSLEEVKVKVGLKVEVPNFFAGCRKLAKVDGVINITNAPGVFSNVDSLATVYITGTVIPERAFTSKHDVNSTVAEKNKLATVKVVSSTDTIALVPTIVGDKAFEGCESLTTMDLSATTSIGKLAFANTGLKQPKDKETLMKIGATTIGAQAFSGAKLTYVDFVNATSIGDAILVGNEITSLRFQKAFTIVGEPISATKKYSAYTFGASSTGIALYVANGQQYVNGNSLVLTYTDNTVTPAVPYTQTITFKSIKVAAAE